MNESLFPSKDESILSLLNRTIKVYPHHNNTGGFFLALFRKTSSQNISNSIHLEEQKEENIEETIKK